ncbi:MAG: pyridoxal phosphate-dependent aminotransferase [Desulfobacteraceae bacterium]|jgi:aspartate aminotransferase
MSISEKIRKYMSQSSWTRKMFEKGAMLKAQYGTDNVYDFSLGNPNVPPPDKFSRVLGDTVKACGPGVHGYMPQAGFSYVRKSIADYLTQEQEVKVEAEEVLMTCGAAGALNVILKALLDPGDEVLIPIPYFSEYRFYVDNHGGNVVFVPTLNDFSLDLDAMEKSLSKKTKAVLINSPNNPTGQIYSQESLAALGTLLTEKSKSFGRTLYLISDEPYRKIVFENNKTPSIFKAYPNSLIATSYSKDLSLAGERIGFAAINPSAEFKEDLVAALNLTNRILGFVNAPALMQRVVSHLQGLSVDIAIYERKRNLLCEGLADAGYDFITPPGTFYLFPKTPIEDDVQFVAELQEEQILVVPGSGFAGPGHFRMAFCVEDRVIENALPGFKRAMAKYR